MLKIVEVLAGLFVCAALLQTSAVRADQVNVRYKEGLLHGFLALRTVDGKTLAVGDLTQNTNGDIVTSKLLLRFKDGSTHEETTVFLQHEKFRVMKYHIVQKGPVFKHPQEMSLDTASGQVTVRYTEDDGKEKALTEHMELPPDLSNGIVPTSLKNLHPIKSQATVSMLAATPKPRLIKLVITPQAEDKFSVGGFNRNAAHYVLKVEIGGVAGVVAPLVGKQPPDNQIWILGGEAPVFLRSEGPLYEGGPIWTIQLFSPTWSQKPVVISRKE